MPVDLAGNTLGTARGLNITPTSQTFTDYVDSLDPNDYYTFTFSSSSSLNLAVNGLTDDADVQLLNRRGQVLQSSTNSDTNAEFLNTNLGAGTYYIRVLPYEGASTSYNLSVSTAPASNILTPERDLGVLSGTTSFKDSVGSTDTSDTYRFSLTGTTNNLNLTLAGLTADVNARLIRDTNNNGLVDTGEVLASSVLTGTAVDSLNLSNLAAGNYFAQVYQFGGDSNYTLHLSNTNPSNLLQPRVELGNLTTTPITRTDAVGSTDTSDIYRFNLTSAINSVNFSLSGLTADTNVRLIRDGNNNGLVDTGEVVSSSNFDSTTSDSLNVSGLAAGSYFAQVYQVSGNTNYTLRLSSASPSNLLNPEANLGAITATPITRTGLVNSIDTSDIYGFSLTGTTNSLNLAFTSAEEFGYADVRLIRDANNNGILDAGELLAVSSTVSNPINLSGLTAGSYFVQVYQLLGDGGYRFSLSASTPNNLISPESNLGTISSNATTITGFVSSTDTSDMYGFSIASPTTTASILNISLTGLSADANICLIRDGNRNGVVDAGEVIASSSFVGTIPESINFGSIGSGDFLVQVEQFNGNTNYTLRLSTANPSNLIVPEVNLGTINTTTPTTTYTGSLSRADKSDFYSFSLSETSNLNVSVGILSSPSAPVELRLIRDVNGNGIVDAGEIINSSPIFDFRFINITGLAAGNYFIQASQQSVSFVNTNYLLSLSTSRPSDLVSPEGNPFIPITATPTTITGFVASLDNSDMYGIRLTDTSNFLRVSLTGLNADANVRLVRDANNNGIIEETEVIVSSTASGITAEAIAYGGLAAGNYLVQVYQFLGDTPYSLSLSNNSTANPTALGQKRWSRRSKTQKIA